MKQSGEFRDFARGDLRRNKVLDLNVDGVPNRDAMTTAFIVAAGIAAATIPVALTFRRLATTPVVQVAPARTTGAPAAGYIRSHAAGKAHNRTG